MNDYCFYKKNDVKYLSWCIFIPQHLPVINIYTCMYVCNCTYMFQQVVNVLTFKLHILHVWLLLPIIVALTIIGLISCNSICNWLSSSLIIFEKVGTNNLLACYTASDFYFIWMIMNYYSWIIITLISTILLINTSSERHVRHN